MNINIYWVFRNTLAKKNMKDIQKPLVLFYITEKTLCNKNVMICTSISCSWSNFFWSAANFATLFAHSCSFLHNIFLRDNSNNTHNSNKQMRTPKRNNVINYLVTSKCKIWLVELLCKIFLLCNKNVEIWLVEFLVICRDNIFSTLRTWNITFLQI